MNCNGQHKYQMQITMHKKVNNFTNSEREYGTADVLLHLSYLGVDKPTPSLETAVCRVLKRHCHAYSLFSVC